jgi:hypothetical protein
MPGKKRSSSAKKQKRKFHIVKAYVKKVGRKKVRIKAHLKSMPKLKRKTVAKKKAARKK